jgi:hypothetical protein
MKEIDLLHSIEKMIKDQKMDASFFAPTEKIPYESLVVFLGADSQKRPYVLNITAQKQVVDPKKESNLFYVQKSITRQLNSIKFIIRLVKY